MEDTLRKHILFLENTLQELSNSLTVQGLSTSVRERIQKRIDLASDALEHYRQGFELEHVLRSTNRTPPPASQQRP